MQFYHEFSIPRAGSNAVRKESRGLWDFKDLREMHGGVKGDQGYPGPKGEMGQDGFPGRKDDAGMKV